MDKYTLATKDMLLDKLQSSIAAMPLDELQIINNLAVAEQVQRMQSRLESMQNAMKQTERQLEIMKEEHEFRTQLLESEVEKAKTMAATNQRVREPKYGWVNQGDFGRFLNPSIGSGTMGKFLKAVGLAMPSKGPTTPYRKYIGKYAETIAHEHFTQTRWNYENCMQYIDDWLKEHNLFEVFYSLETTKEVKQFIDNL